MGASLPPWKYPELAEKEIILKYIYIYLYIFFPCGPVFEDYASRGDFVGEKTGGLDHKQFKPLKQEVLTN